MRPVDLPWGVTHEGKVAYFDPYDDWGRDDTAAINFNTRFSTESKADIARMVMTQANHVIQVLAESEDSDKLAELFIQLEEFRLD